MSRPSHIAISIFATILILGAEAGASSPDAAFEILRKGDPIGYHAVNVEETAEGTKVETRIRMRVHLGPITLFRYDHHSREFWRDGALLTLESATQNNGRQLRLNVNREGDALIVDGADYRGEAPPDTIPSSYWNKDITTTSLLLNTQTGGLMRVKTEALGRTPAPNGALADHHRLIGSVALNLWYEGRRWVGADFVIRGEVLSYRLLDDASREMLFSKINLGP